MKRLLSVLLGLMLPVFALADTYNLSIQLETNENTFLDFISEGLKTLPEYDSIHTEKEAKLIQQILEDLDASMTVQDNACSLLVRMNQKELFDVTAYQNNEELLFTSTLLPEYVLTIPVESNNTYSVHEKIDWEHICSNIYSVLSEWIAELDQLESRGLITGDAFESGSKCTAWHFDDREISVLLQRILDLDIRDGLDLLCESSDNVEMLMKDLVVRNQRAAEENNFEYFVRVIQDEEDDIEGVTFTALQRGQQVATVSLGFPEDGIRIVVGLGIGSQNYWCEITGKANTVEERFTLMTSLREWACAKDETFSYVQALRTPSNICEWHFEIDSDEHVNSIVTANGQVLLTADGFYNQTLESFGGRLYLGSKKKAPLSVCYDIKTADPIQATDQTLTECSLINPEDAELLNTIIQKVSVSLIARLLKMMPVELMLQ